MLRTLRILRNHDLWSKLRSWGSNFISLPAHVIFSMFVASAVRLRKPWASMESTATSLFACVLDGAVFQVHVG